jgi:diadenylate cyclase
MTLEAIAQFAARHWRDALEILILAAGIYGGWLFIRSTRGARVLTGLAIFFIGVMLLSQVLELRIIGWLFRNLSTFLAFALVVIFQPELRRALAALGSHRLLSLVSGSRQTVEVLTELTFNMANKHLGALIAIEREASLEEFAESGVVIDAQLSQELLVTIFFPKTPLHDGGVIIRNDRVVSAACIFPITQRSDLDRNLGLRHRAGLGLTEEFDAVVIVVSEETGIVSICHRGVVERNFDPESFQVRLNELLLPNGEDDAKKNEEAAAPALGREDRRPRARRRAVGGHPEEHRDDRLAF